MNASPSCHEWFMMYYFTDDLGGHVAIVLGPRASSFANRLQRMKLAPFPLFRAAPDARGSHRRARVLGDRFLKAKSNPSASAYNRIAHDVAHDQVVESEELLKQLDQRC